MGPLTKGGVLCLDLAGTVGWAYGPVNDRNPSFGIWHLPKIGGEGARYAAFENELAATIEACEPSALVLEAALSLGAFMGAQMRTNVYSIRQQWNLRGFAYCEAWRASVPVSEIDSYTARLEVLGTGRFTPKTVKQEVVRYCMARGWRVPDHNAGDACILWQWHKQRILGSSPVAGPLWRDAVERGRVA